MFKTIIKLLCSKGLIAKMLSNTYNHVEFDTKLGGFEVQVNKYFVARMFYASERTSCPDFFGQQKFRFLK